MGESLPSALTAADREVAAGSETGALRETEKVKDDVRKSFDRVLASYESISARFSDIGGIGKLLGVVEEAKRQLDRVSDVELQRVADQIKDVVEELLRVDYELRKIQNLKLLFDQRGDRSAGETDEGERDREPTLAPEALTVADDDGDVSGKS